MAALREGRCVKGRHGKPKPGAGARHGAVRKRPHADAAEPVLAVDMQHTRTVLCVGFGILLRRLREGFGISRAEIVARSGLAPSTVSDIEDRRMYVSIESGERFAFALGVELWKITLVAEAEAAARVVRAGTGGAVADSTAAEDRSPISPCEFTRRVAALLRASPEVAAFLRTRARRRRM